MAKLALLALTAVVAGAALLGGKPANAGVVVGVGIPGVAVVAPGPYFGYPYYGYPYYGYAYHGPYWGPGHAYWGGYRGGYGFHGAYAGGFHGGYGGARGVGRR